MLLLLNEVARFFDTDEKAHSARAGVAKPTGVRRIAFDLAGLPKGESSETFALRRFNPADSTLRIVPLLRFSV
jgi:hypothetical protein